MAKTKIQTKTKESIEHTSGVDSRVEDRVMVGFEVTVLGDVRSIDSRELVTGEGESASDLLDPGFPNLATLGVFGAGLLAGVSYKPDLPIVHNVIINHYTLQS